MSTFVGVKPLLAEHGVTVDVPTIERWDKKNHKIKEYNLHMGGVDIMDSHLGRLKIVLKSRKWYIRIFYHLLELCMVNSWLLFQIEYPAITMTQKAFRLEVAQVLTKLANKKGKIVGQTYLCQALEAKMNNIHRMIF